MSAPQLDPAARPRPLQLLVLEDDPGDARLVATMLAEAPDLELHVEERLAPALQHLAAHGCDLVLLDLGLPDSQGLDTLRAVRRAAPHAPIVVLTGSDDEEVGRAAVREGAQDYVSKREVVGSTLLRSIRYALERQEHLGRLRRSEVYARGLIEATLDPMATIDPEGRITDVNRAAEEVTGVPRDRLVGTGFVDHVTDPEQARAAFAQVLEAGALRDVPLTIRHAGGGATEVLCNASRYAVNGEVQGVLVAARDVTERRRAGAERRRMEERLREALKLEAVARLAGGVSHEFSNVLTVILVAADFLARDVGAEGPRERIEDIRQAAGRAAALTSQLLVFSRCNLVAPRVLDLNEVVTRMERMLRPTIGENVELVVETGAALERVRADPSQLEQVIANLVLNARDAMPAGGQITIRTANADAPSAGVPGVRRGRGVLLAVRDTGHGMDADVRAHLFEPFFTTKPAGKGTGLGLSTVYSIVKHAGGDVRVASEPGAGTTVEVYLPREDEEPVAPVIHAPRGSEAILLVEDEPVLRGLEAKVLRDLGYEVVSAGDGEEACRIAARRSRPFDLVVTDVVMPRMGGRELVSRLRAERPGTVALFVSGYAEPLRGLEAKGPEGPLLQKPFTAELLARSVREVLDRRTAAAGAPAAVSHPG